MPFGFFLLLSRRSGAAAGALRGAAAFLEYTACLAADLLGSDPQFTQDVHCLAFIGAHHAKQNMLCSDVVVPHAAGFFDGELQYFLDP